MTARLPRILVVADQIPPAPGAISALLARPDLRFHILPMESAPDALAEQDYTAAVVLAPHAFFNGSQPHLVRVLDALCAKHIGAVMVTFSSDDLAAAGHFANADGLMAVPHSCPTEELAGRLAGLLAAKPLVDQLRHENAVLRKFEHCLNNQMNQLDEEMRLAARLQIDFLPRQLPSVNGCGFHVLFRPASYVSGDIYDAQRLDEHHLAFYVADAVGHGMPAALLTIFIKRVLQTKEILPNGYRIIPPDEALTHLNNELLNQQLSLCQFVTMVYCILDTRTLELQFARAGHPLPLHLSRDGQARDLEVDGALLGVFPDEVFPRQTMQLQPGDAILLYSDGFETAFNQPGSGSHDRYRREFADLAGPDPAARLKRLEATLDRQEGSLHPHDDLTALMLTTPIK